jgi:DNA-binding NtrC family response regulator
MSAKLPRILIIDDLFGRCLANGTNEDRDNLCASFMLRDITGDVLTDKKTTSRQKIKSPIAEAVFIRGQTPDCAGVGDQVNNDLEGTLRVVEELWTGAGPGFERLSLLLLDLCFYQGVVTGKLSSAVGGTGSNEAEPGMPEGKTEDIVPREFFGLKLLKAIHTRYPDLPIVILSSQDRDKVSQEYSAHGALGFLPRTAPNGDEQLRTFLDRHGLFPDPHGLIIGRSLSLMKALRAVRRTAYNDSRDNILIRGERGTGKSEIARYIHRVHPCRRAKEFVSINSAGLTSGLFASELFGIEKRTATGVDERRGKIEEAHHGDLFLDEVKDLIPEAQAALLVFLEDGTFRPLGGDRDRDVDVRVISATNADLHALAAAGKYREDLLDRLRRGGTILLPSLNDRREDIPLLTEKFLRTAENNQASGANPPPKVVRSFSVDSIVYLTHLNYAGNIRDLRDVCKEVLNVTDSEYFSPENIDEAIENLKINGMGCSRRSQVPNIDPEDRQLKISTAVQPNLTLSSLIDTIQRFEFDLTDPDVLYAQLDAIDEIVTKLVVRYLLTSLRINKDHATGEPEVTKAMKFASGKHKLATSVAYDVIKRLLKRNAEVFDWAMSEPLLKQAYEQAESTRLSNRAKKASQ